MSFIKPAWGRPRCAIIWRPLTSSQCWRLSLHHQSGPSISLSYEHLQVTRGWFIMCIKVSKKPFTLSCRGGNQPFAFSQELLIFHLSIKGQEWKETLCLSIKVFCSHCQRICSLHSSLSTCSRLEPPPTLFLMRNVRNFLRRPGNLRELWKRKKERKKGMKKGKKEGKDRKEMTDEEG